MPKFHMSKLMNNRPLTFGRFSGHFWGPLTSNIWSLYECLTWWCAKSSVTKQISQKYCDIFLHQGIYYWKFLSLNGNSKLLALIRVYECFRSWMFSASVCDLKCSVVPVSGCWENWESLCWYSSTVAWQEESSLKNSCCHVVLQKYCIHSKLNVLILHND